MEPKTPPQMDSKFRRVLVAASRAEQLMRGARPKLEADKRKATSVAMDEIDGSLVDWDYGPPPPKEVPKPEGEAEEQPAEVH
jgi:DNA-directed RNA polymerase omega subunit